MTGLAPASGIAITLSRAGSEFAMVVTTASGEFGFTDLEAGTYVLAISEISGMRCVTHQAATVAPGETPRLTPR